MDLYDHMCLTPANMGGSDFLMYATAAHWGHLIYPSFVNCFLFVCLIVLCFTLLLTEVVLHHHMCLAAANLCDSA